jgi:hypothetical protein
VQHAQHLRDGAGLVLVAEGQDVVALGLRVETKRAIKSVMVRNTQFVLIRYKIHKRLTVKLRKLQIL